MPKFDQGQSYLQAFTSNQMEYILSDVDESDADYYYYGYLSFRGDCIISRLTNDTGAFRFFKSKKNYTTHWTGKASLNYVYYNQLFQ